MLEKLFNIKKRFFNQELAKTTANVWATEFSIYTTKIEYQRTQQLYSQGKDQLAQLSKDDKNRETLEKQVKQLEESLDELNTILNGSVPNEKYPEGVRGLHDKLAAQVQKRENIKNFIKYNC